MTLLGSVLSGSPATFICNKSRQVQFSSGRGFMGNVPSLTLCMRAKGHGRNRVGTSGMGGYYDEAVKFEGL